MKRPHLNRRLVLERAAQVPDGAGGFARDWNALGDLWAAVTARTGRERARDGATLSSVRYRIVVRAAPMGSEMRPQPDQRFRDGDRVFAIRAVAEQDSQGRFLTCFAEEEVAA
jgi:head-tail adaptor